MAFNCLLKAVVSGWGLSSVVRTYLYVLPHTASLGSKNCRGDAHDDRWWGQPTGDQGRRDQPGDQGTHPSLSR